VTSVFDGVGRIDDEPLQDWKARWAFRVRGRVENIRNSGLGTALGEKWGTMAKQTWKECVAELQVKCERDGNETLERLFAEDFEIGLRDWRYWR
jgi:hypothetical protein